MKQGQISNKNKENRMMVHTSVQQQQQKKESSQVHRGPYFQLCPRRLDLLDPGTGRDGVIWRGETMMTPISLSPLSYSGLESAETVLSSLSIL